MFLQLVLDGRIDDVHELLNHVTMYNEHKDAIDKIIASIVQIRFE